MGVISVIFILIFFVYQWHVLTCVEVVRIGNFIDDEDSKDTQLFDIYKEAKKISHAKKIVEGLSELRRSIIKKKGIEKDKNDLEKWIQVLNNDSSQTLVALQELEYLVHQIEVANSFMNAGGIDKMFELMDHGDSSVTSEALTVLTAAMQGNPDIQSYVKNFHLVYYFRKAVENKSPSLSKYISAISSYVRNVPAHQLEFLYGQGLEMLASILQDYNLPFNIKYKVIDFLGDLATEIFYDDRKSEDSYRIILQEFFQWNANKSRICEEVPSYLDFEGFYEKEKVVVAMNALHVVCLNSFQKEYVIKLVKNVKKDFIEQKWYSTIDEELLASMIDGIDTLMRKIVKLGKKDEL